jgi:hypothetical protein
MSITVIDHCMSLTVLLVVIGTDCMGSFHELTNTLLTSTDFLEL